MTPEVYEFAAGLGAFILFAFALWLMMAIFS